MESNLCSICLDSIALPGHITICGHKFCTSCILSWTMQQGKMDKPTTCPICRTPITVEELLSVDEKAEDVKNVLDERCQGDQGGESQHNVLFYSMHPNDSESREILSILASDELLDNLIRKICVYPNRLGTHIPAFVLKLNRLPILFISDLEKPLIGKAALNWCKNISEGRSSLFNDWSMTPYPGDDDASDSSNFSTSWNSSNSGADSLFTSLDREHKSNRFTDLS